MRDAVSVFKAFAVETLLKRVQKESYHHACRTGLQLLRVRCQSVAYEPQLGMEPTT